MNNVIPEIPPVGANLKRERMAKKLSLGSLAEKSGISKAMLSQIEAGKVNPTLVTLWKVSHALDIDISFLIGGKKKSEDYFHLLRAGEQAEIQCEKGITFKILSAPGIPASLEMYLMMLEPGAGHRSEPHEPGRKEFVLVTKGSVRVTSGDTSADLEPGDFLSYRGDLPHSICNTGRTEAELHMTDLALP